jgi:hypothetical protein
MSSLSRNSWLLTALRCALAMGALAGMRPVAAQQITFVPQGEVSAEWASNRILTVPATSASDEALKLGGDLIRTSPLSDLQLRPLVTFQNGSIRNLDLLEALVDLVGNWRTERGTYTLNSEYHRQDAFNAQFGTAGYNSLNPNLPDTTATGQVLTGITQSTYVAEPGFSYKFTQRWGIEGSASFEAVRYSTEVPDLYVSYNAPYVGVNALWVASQNSQLSIGPYYTRFDPIRHDFDSVVSDDYGIAANYKIRFSKLDTSTITVRVERDRSPTPPVGVTSTVKSSANSWGLEWTGTHTFLTGQVRYSIGRFLEPSSIGGRTAEDQMRFQYNRPLSDLLSANIAARVTRENDIDNPDDAGNRDRANVEASLRRQITALWYVMGGYRFAYQRLPSQTQSAASNGVFISVGYHGLDPPGH